MKGIEPSYAAWEAAVLPLNYTRMLFESITIIPNRVVAVKPKIGAGPKKQRIVVGAMRCYVSINHEDAPVGK